MASRTLSYPKNKINVLLLENVHPLAKERFSKEGYNIETINTALSEDQLIEKIQNISILGIRSKTQITDKIINSGKRLLAIGAFCIGTNQVDLESSAKFGIPVFNAPYSNTRSVVELIVGEIIALSRKLFDKSSDMHRGIWNKSSSGCREIRGKKLGIIGYGNIGSQLSVLAENLGMQVYYYDIADKLSLGNAIRCKTMRELLKISDILTVHVDGRKENKNLIGKSEFALMKSTAFFLNASRGFVVDIEALASAVKNKKIAGCAVDVYPVEPKGNGEGFVSELQGLPNVILTPHVGAGTEEAQRNIADYLSNKLIQFVNTGTTTLSVNMPEIQLSEVKKVHRLVHMHHNVPGVLAKINLLLAKHKINIEAQYLKTNEHLGYVITDVDKIYSKEIVAELKGLEETIRVRTLY